MGQRIVLHVSRRPNTLHFHLHTLIVYVARCPEHGLHGCREDCHDCGGPVEFIQPPATRRTLSVPVARRAMSIGTLSRLLKDAEISREEVRKLL